MFEQAMELAKPLIEALLGQHGFMVQVVAVVGALRLVFKPVMSAARAYVLSTPSTKDDAVLDKVEGHKAYKIAVYLLDYIASIKVQKK